MLSPAKYLEIISFEGTKGCEMHKMYACFTAHIALTESLRRWLTVGCTADAYRGADYGDCHPFSGGQVDCFLRREGVRDFIL